LNGIRFKRVRLFSSLAVSLNDKLLLGKMNLTHIVSYSRLRSLISNPTKRCRKIISDIRNSKSASSDAAGCAVKNFFPLKQGMNKQQKILLPFVPVLRKQQKDLTELSGNTENEFLLLGTRLQDFSSRAKSLAEQSTHIAGLFDGNREDNPLDRAGRVSEETLAILKMFDAETIEATSRINLIAAKIKRLSKHKRDFDIISRTLRVLGINIKIQGAQISEGSDNSFFLADGISKLSIKTNIIVNKLFSCLKRADASILPIAGRIDQYLQKDRSQTAQTEKRISKALGKLKGMFDLSTGLSANIASRSSEISKRVSAVVISMQFHDISRQIMEHVAEAMEDICKKIEGYPASDNGCGQHLAAYTSKIATVQMSQMDLVAYEMEDAEKKMITALEEIARRTADQSEEISNVSGAGETKSDDSIIVQFSSEISTVISSLSEKTDINRYILEEVKAVSKTVKEMSSFIKDVENIAESIKLLALNAQIKAEHIGESALALGALAREVRDISIQSNKVVGKISTGIKAILKTSDDLQTRISSIFADGIRDAENLKQRSAEAGNGLNALNREMVENNSGLNKKSRELALDISALTSKIQFSRKVVECIGHIKETMRDLIETAGPYNLATKAELNEPALDGLNNRYTMESERIAHEKAFGSSPMESGNETNLQAAKFCRGEASAGSVQDTDQNTEIDNVELFENFDMPDEQNEKVEIFDQKKKDDDDLGDNIELF